VTFEITRKTNYPNIKVYNVTEVKYERDFVLFFDVQGLKIAVNSDTVSRIDRT
jgi:hypothetical protein